MLRINFSGHPVADHDVAPLVGVNLPMTSGPELLAAITAALEAAVYCGGSPPRTNETTTQKHHEHQRHY